jgi:hypothetical protein
MEPGQLEQRRLQLQSLPRHLSIQQSFFPFASPMLIARNRQRCDGWPVPEPSRPTRAFGVELRAYEKSSRMKHAGAVGKCDRASQQTFNSRAPEGFLFFPPELHIFPDL